MELNTFANQYEVELSMSGIEYVWHLAWATLDINASLYEVALSMSGIRYEWRSIPLPITMSGIEIENVL